MITTYRKILAYGEKELALAGVPEADWDTWLIMERCFGLDRSRYFLERDQEKELSGQQMETFRRLLDDRKKRIPLQYLFHTQEFMGLPFYVSEAVLIPRQDTEILVETVLRDCGGKAASVLDVCTGSGCIAVALACLGHFGRVDGTDLSEAALRVAVKNAEQNGAEVRFFRGDLLDEIRETYDIIVSNPPYIKDSVIEGLEPEVRDYEPRMALSGGADGLEFYRRLAADAGRHLNPGGRIYLEIGYDQAAAVAGLLKEKHFSEVRIQKDLAGNDRVVSARYATEGANPELSQVSPGSSPPREGERHYL